MVIHTHAFFLRAEERVARSDGSLQKKKNEEKSC